MMDKMSEGCVELWQHVLRRAIIDATYRGKGVESAREARFAHDWIMFGGRDFEIVCLFAGVDPEVFRERYRAGKIKGRSLGERKAKNRWKNPVIRG